MNADDTLRDPWTLRAVRALAMAWVVALVLALYPYTQNPAGPIKDLITAWAALAMAVVYLVGMLRDGLGLRASGATLGLLGAFLAVNVASALVSGQVLYSLDALRPWIAGGAIAVIVGNSFRTTAQLWTLVQTVVVAVALSSVYGYVQRWGLDPFPWAARNIEEYRGMPATYANPNFAGHTLIPATIMALGVLAFRSRVIGGVAVALIASHLYLTDMRAARVALLAAAALLGLYFLLLRVHRARPLRAATWTLGISLLLAGAGVLGGLAYTATKVEGALPIDSALILRLNGYYGAARMALEQPVLGFGPGQYEIEAPRYWTNFEQRWYAAEGKKNDHLHNDLLETAVDAGLLGAGLYLALLVWGLVQALVLIASRGEPDRRRLGLVLAGCIAAFAVDGLFGFNLRVPVSAGLFFVLLGVLHALLQPPAARNARGVLLQAGLVVVALVVVAGATTSFYAASCFQRARGLQAYAAEARASGDFAGVKAGNDAALAALAEGERWQPFRVDFAEAAGQICLARGRGEEAVAAFERALLLNPNMPALHAGVAQGWITQAMGRDKAKLLGEIPDPEVLRLVAPGEAAARAALQIAPRFAPAHEALGQAAILRAQHEPANAVKHWRAAADRLNDALIFGARSAGSIHKSLARIYTAREDYAAAAAAYRRVVAAQPDDADTWDALEKLAKDHARTEDYIDALGDAVWKVRVVQPENVTLLDDLTVRLAHATREADGNSYIRRLSSEALAKLVVQRSADRADAWNLLNESSMPGPGETGAPPAWMTELRDLNSNPKNIPALNTTVLEAARADAAAGMHASGLRFRYAVPAQKLQEELKHWLDDLPRARTLAQIAELHGIAQSWAACEAAAAEALLVLPAEEGLAMTLLRVKALVALARPAEALVAAREAVRLQPGAPDAKWALAQQLLANGKLAEARFAYQALLRQTSPDAPEHGQTQLEAAQVEARLAHAQGVTTP